MNPKTLTPEQMTVILSDLFSTPKKGPQKKGEAANGGFQIDKIEASDRYPDTLGLLCVFRLIITEAEKQIAIYDYQLYIGYYDKLTKAQISSIALWERIHGMDHLQVSKNIAAVTDKLRHYGIW